MRKSNIILIAFAVTYLASASSNAADRTVLGELIGRTT